MIKQGILRQTGYRLSGGNDGIRLNMNENPCDVSGFLKERVLERLKAAQWNRYPEMIPNRLLDQLARYTGQNPENLLVSNGSDDLIQILLLACCNQGDRMLTVTPTFGVYKSVADTLGVNTLEIPLENDFSWNVGRLIDRLKGDPSIKISFLASPNNPTGGILEKYDVEAICRSATGAVVLDEAYFEFCGESAAPLLERFPNLIILRTLSKALRCAGFRIGYLMAVRETVDALRKVKLPFSLGLPAQIAGECALESLNSEPELWDVSPILAERERVFRVLSVIPGIIPYPSRANFILVRLVGLSISAILDNLFRDGICVREFDDPALIGCFRVTIGAPAENDCFLRSIRDTLAGASTKE